MKSNKDMTAPRTKNIDQILLTLDIEMKSRANGENK